MDSPSEFEPSEFEPSGLGGQTADGHHNCLPDPMRPRVVFTGQADASDESHPSEQTLCPAPELPNQSESFPVSKLAEKKRHGGSRFAAGAPFGRRPTQVEQRRGWFFYF